jgi:hypothetical protein
MPTGYASLIGCSTSRVHVWMRLLHNLNWKVEETVGLLGVSFVER